MIEISLTELVLLLWAIAATATALHYRDTMRHAKNFLRAMIEDEGVRTKVLKEYEDFKAKVRRET